MEGHTYHQRTDWWDHILSIPEPRVIVAQDIDKRPGLGSFIGEVHANIFLALGCNGMVTNGSLRDIPGVKSAGFQVFAGCVSVSHAFAHIFDFGGPVEVGHMKVRPGDLIHGDRHGVQTVPISVAERIPETAKRILEKEQELIAFCRSGGFTIDQLRQKVAETKS